MNKKEIENLIKWWKNTDTQGMDIVKHLISPIMDAFGDDENAILAYLNDMGVEDLGLIFGCFEAIYGKFTTAEVYEALGKLEDKLNNE